MDLRPALYVALLAATLAGCASQPLEYRSQLEIPEGPGMFSGEDGAFVFRTRAARPAIDE